MRSIILVAASMALLTGAKLQAQQQSGPTAGTWGAEVREWYDGSLLRFRSPSSAWLLGIGASYARTEREDTGIFPSSETREYSSAFVRIGLRRYRNVDRAARPFSTLSAIAGVGNTFTRFWSAGAGAEIGAAYFFSPHVSLGASGELSAVYTRGETSTSEEQTWFVRFSGFRLLAGVYF